MSINSYRVIQVVPKIGLYYSITHLKIYLNVRCELKIIQGMLSLIIMRSYSWRRMKVKVPNLINKRNVKLEFKEAIVHFLIERDGTICAICNKELEEPIVIDHIQRVYAGGENRLYNFRATHFICNKLRF